MNHTLLIPDFKWLRGQACIRALPFQSWRNVATGHNLWLHFGVDEHPFATYFHVHQGFSGF